MRHGCWIKRKITRKQKREVKKNACKQSLAFVQLPYRESLIKVVARYFEVIRLFEKSIRLIMKWMFILRRKENIREQKTNKLILLIIEFRFSVAFDLLVMLPYFSSLLLLLLFFLSASIFRNRMIALAMSNRRCKLNSSRHTFHHRI